MKRSDARMAGDAEAKALVREALAAHGATWLQERRWFADKGRAVAAVSLVDAMVDQRRDEILALAIVRVEFESGTAALYFLPLAVVPNGNGERHGPHMPLLEHRVLVDATERPWFGRWLLEAMLGKRESATTAWDFTAAAEATDLLHRAASSPGSVMRAEQSNTSIRFGDALIAKIVRRLQPAPNPEEEVLWVLADARFPAVPAFAGSGAWRNGNGTTYPLLLAQAFVPNQGDGWNWTLARLNADSFGERPPDRFAPEALLGRRTAELHVALSQSTAKGFTAERADEDLIFREVVRTRASIADVVQLLKDQEQSLPGTIRSRLDDVTAGLAKLADQAEGYRAEIGLTRIRVHGDYHLGQTLRTAGDDWMIIDFEGEPARSVSERRERTSVLKDVAGMLRSFAYARGVHERSARNSLANRHAEAWERAARTAFLSAYRQHIGQAGGQLVPDTEREFARALAAWELDKALYEIEYELRNRPDWLEVPLRGLLPHVPDQAPDATGAAPA